MNGFDNKSRVYHILTGFGPKHNLGVLNLSVESMAKALLERYYFCKEGGVFRPALVVNPRTYRRRLITQFLDNVSEQMPNLPRLSRQQVVDRYSGSKRRLYQDALLSLQRKSLRIEDSYLNSFPKYEKQDLSKAPRAINPRSPRYNLELGTFIKHAEKPFYKAINKTFKSKAKSTIMKGLNADDTARQMRIKWDSYRNPVALPLDAIKFDMHVSISALKYEHKFYKRLFPGSRKLKELLRWQLNNKGFSYMLDGKLKFEMRGTRCSGDLNTSLGACLIMCGIIYTIKESLQVDLELCNNGDDCVLIMDRSDLHRVQARIRRDFRRHGFSIMPEEPVYEFEHIEFCQTRPVLLDTGWRMVRKHSTVLRKDPICLVDIPNARVFRKWMDAVGTGGSILNKGVPVQQSFYEAFIRNGERSSEKFRNYIYKNTSHYARIDGIKNSAEITAVSRVSYYYAFGVLPDHQIEMEKYYDRIVVEERIEPKCDRESVMIESGISLINYS